MKKKKTARLPLPKWERLLKVRNQQLKGAASGREKSWA